MRSSQLFSAFLLRMMMLAIVAIVLAGCLIIWHAWRRHVVVRSLINDIKADGFVLEGFPRRLYVDGMSRRVSEVKKLGASDAAVAELVVILKSDQQGARWFAASALGEFGVHANGAIAQLEIATEGSDEILREIATAAIERIRLDAKRPGRNASEIDSMEAEQFPGPAP